MTDRNAPVAFKSSADDVAALLRSLIRQPGMSDGQFAKDRGAVANDLKTLTLL